ncbi:siderophore-interacting protein [Streptomyces sp. P38-E01]|uniref:Siderophore-interacting protein n=1 Tax=Streptomyces tardus TaxID=2780544 RepID=A0A949NAD0_9ACTN|nr:siderophore-interacting protein [Streptomyces tardus]MBU7599763.1 siderophore-interacting protein [Streptomyces tardus]
MAVSAPSAFRFFPVRVARSTRLSPSLVRITFAGESLRDFDSGGRDQSFSLFLPHPGQELPVLPDVDGDGWFAAWRAMDPEVRAIMRSYTVREHRRSPRGPGPGPAGARDDGGSRDDGDEVDVDFALHGDLGPASRWARAARPGDRTTLLGPAVRENKSIGFRLPQDADWVLLAADETALPAVAGILDWLPPTVPAHIWLEVPDTADRRALPHHPGAKVNWLVHEGSPARRGELLTALREAPFPAGAPYAWLAGEAGAVRAMRRHLVRERGLDRARVQFSGYWRLGATEEDLRREALAG